MATKTKEEFSVNYSELLQEVLTKKGTISTCFRTFHNYSVNNQFLLYWQLHCRGKQVSPVNSYTRWQALGRQVRGGESGMYLWVPITFKANVKDEETGEVKQVPIIKGFKYKKGAFSLDQTDSIKGEEFSVSEIQIPNFDFNKVYDYFGIKLVPFTKLNGNIQGYANPETRELAINPLAEDPEMTILHEVAHIAMKHNDCKYDSSLKELEAESIAYIVGSILGLS